MVERMVSVMGFMNLIPFGVVRVGGSVPIV